MRARSDGPAQLTVRGLADPATHYEERRERPWRKETPLDRIVRQVVADVAKESGADAPKNDDRLSATAQILAQAMYGRVTPSSEMQLYARSQTGVTEPITELSFVTIPREFFVHGNIQELRDHVRRVVSRSTLTHFGVGIKEGLAGQVTILIVFTRRAIQIVPFPTSLPLGASHDLVFELDAPFTEPDVYVAPLEDGAVSAPALANDDGRYTMGFTCPDTPGRWLMEVFGSDSFGPRILANIVVACGQTHPSSVRVEVERTGETVDAKTVETALLDLVNLERHKQGAPPVVLDEAAADVARAHALDMADNEFFGHVSPNTGSPADRAKKAGITVSVGENIALASSIENVHRGLMSSPGHRMLILDPTMQRLGVGAVVRDLGPGRQSIWATELFTRPAPNQPVAPPKPPPGTVRVATKRDGLFDCNTLGLSSAVASDTAKETLIAEGAALGANTVFFVERTIKGTKRVTAEFYRCKR